MVERCATGHRFHAVVYFKKLRAVMGTSCNVR